MLTTKLTRDILLAALAGFQLDKQRIDARIAEVQDLLATPETNREAPGKGRRKRSAAVRRRMADAQKARWAKIKGVSESQPATPEAPKAKGTISEEGMKRIVAATKKRWKLQKAAKSAVAKKGAKAKAPVKKVAARKAAVKKPATASAPAVTQAATE